MDLGLNGRKALVLAASQGLGLASAERLAAEGADVVITGRSRERLVAASEAITARGAGRAFHVVADLGEPGAAERILADATAALGSIDILVNNSGGPPPGAVAAVAADVWQREFEKMVLPLVEITRLAVAPMRARGYGRIVTIASSGVVQPIVNLGISNALRSSLVGFMKTLAAEVAADGITVNMVAPGRIATARVGDIDRRAAETSGRSVEDIQRASIATIPAARYGRVEEFSAVVAFLASAPASYVTGSIVRVDGGMIRSV